MKNKNRYMKTIAAMNKILVYCHEHYNECDSKGQSELAKVNQAAKDAVELLKAQRKVIRDLCTLGYPHNFQHEAPWVAQYCRDVSGVITEAFEVNDVDDET